MKQKQKYHRQQLFVDGLPLFLGRPFFVDASRFYQKILG